MCILRLHELFDNLWENFPFKVSYFPIKSQKNMFTFIYSLSQHIHHRNTTKRSTFLLFLQPKKHLLAELLQNSTNFSQEKRAKNID
ncbi:hypothetical protein CW304_06925 [Bacillus sp. UFRGS-B20]|nr:hypothetical protein CW304_06925 [Bacillus sp. UFRGS-B20]